MSILTLLLAVELAQAAVPSPVATPPTIIRIKSTPFCQVFRDNVFRAVQGLRVNDLVIDQGHSILAKWAYDSVVDSGKIRGGSVKMDRYQLGLVVGDAAHNLERIYAVLNDPERFPTEPQSDADRDLAKMKQRLEAVADAQERSLNILSGTYETEALYALLSLGNDTAGALQQASIGDKILELGDPILTAPGYVPPPTAASQAHASLFASTSVGRIATGLGVSQRITGAIEDRVGSTVAPGIDRCRAEMQSAP